jgi:hypothetical protein
MEEEQAVTGHAPALDISPLKALIGEPWSIKATGLRPGTGTKLIVEFKDFFDVKWDRMQSSARTIAELWIPRFSP